MITITQEEGQYRAEYSAPEAPKECAEDVVDIEYGDTDLTAALNVQRDIDDQEDADAVWSACAKLRTCGNCKYECLIMASILAPNPPKFGCNAWERKK